MKKVLLSTLVVVAFAGLAWGLATPAEKPAPTVSFVELTAPVANPFAAPVACTEADEQAGNPHSCEGGCQRDYNKCLHQGNDETFCFDSVFCACMCNVCNNCIC